MTKTEAENLKTFKNSCTCGGYAWNINGRPREQPHMSWCPQYNEYGEWFMALQSNRARDAYGNDKLGSFDESKRD